MVEPRGGTIDMWNRDVEYSDDPAFWLSLVCSYASFVTELFSVHLLSLAARQLPAAGPAMQWLVRTK